MRKLTKGMWICLSGLAFMQCRVEPGVEKLSTKPIVATIYDVEADFHKEQRMRL